MHGSRKRRVALTVAWVVAVAATLMVVIRHMRRNPSAYSYRGGGFEIPRPFLKRDELRRVLAPRPGERLLEIGPGKGHYSLDVARCISPDGILDVLDVQDEMLDHTMEAARSQGITNITPVLADAANLPYPDDSFDGAYLVAVLGEVPEKRDAIRELKRIVKPGGRVVVGEAITDPHRVSSRRLRGLMEDAGMSSEREIGGLLGTFYRFAV